MTVIGIVGSEEIKFTDEGKRDATNFIRDILSQKDVAEVVSGACHLGGIDKWAAEIGLSLGLKVTEFQPKSRSWEMGYKPRNLLIAQHSDIVYCVTVKRLPSNYTGMRFPLCYHCGSNDHIKSGGCWTMKQAQKLGKDGRLVVVENAE